MFEIRDIIFVIERCFANSAIIEADKSMKSTVSAVKTPQYVGVSENSRCADIDHSRAHARTAVIVSTHFPAASMSIILYFIVKRIILIGSGIKNTFKR